MNNKTTWIIVSVASVAVGGAVLGAWALKRSKRLKADKALDDSLKESFPASDSPTYSQVG